MKELNFKAFDFNDYRDYLTAVVGPKSQRRGLKQKIASALGVQASFFSAVLKGTQNLSLEQAHRLSEFMGHEKDETEYLLLLVQIARAGTKGLRKHFETQAQTMREARMTIVGRLGQKTVIPEEYQAVYYSSWEYGAVHIAMSVPRLQELDYLEKELQIPRERLIEIIRFLEKCGALTRTEKGLQISSSFHRLQKNSPQRYQFHTNWRLRAVERLRSELPGDTHHSAVYSLSKSDAAKIQDQILEMLKQHEGIIRASPEEDIYAYLVDWFKI